MEVVELFSGIGAQAKALERCNIDHNVLATCDWDINAIIAYDLIHNGPQLDNLYETMSNEQLDMAVSALNVSANGKTPMTDSAKHRLSRNVKIKLLYAIERTNNLLDITEINGNELPSRIDLMTYSFPCQDLSLAGSWHNNSGGIERDSGNRSSLLWEVERLLYERKNEGIDLPKFLLMENVTAILSKKHEESFNEWKMNLCALGYVNKVLTLDARKFGVPQMRNRTYMLSINCQGMGQGDVEYINRIFDNLNEEYLARCYPRERFNLEDVIRKDYNNIVYYHEALESNPNRTPSRIEIGRNNILIDSETSYVPTITTKQDRHPNSGLIEFFTEHANKMNFRYLTPRECFMIMGFDEDDYQMLIDNNFLINKSRYFFTRDKMNKMAGNSICVNVLESIFELIEDIINNLEEL